MAFGLVHSSVERSTSRHGHYQASARLLYRFALVLVLGFIMWKWLNSVHSLDSNQEFCIGFAESLGIISHFWFTQGNLESAEVPRIYSERN